MITKSLYYRNEPTLRSVRNYRIRNIYENTHTYQIGLHIYFYQNLDLGCYKDKIQSLNKVLRYPKDSSRIY